MVEATQGHTLLLLFSPFLLLFSFLCFSPPIKFSPVQCLNSWSFSPSHFCIFLPTPFLLQSLKSFYSYFNLYFFLFLFFLLPILLSTFPALILISIFHIFSYSSSFSISSPLLLLIPISILYISSSFSPPPPSNSCLHSTNTVSSHLAISHNSPCSSSSSSSSSKHKLPRRNYSHGH